MKHFSHPHALKLSELEKKQENDEIICSGCEQELSSGEAAYTCPKRDCEFFLHKSCFELPENMEHKSHPHHKLTLLSEPPQYSLYYDCNACGGLINGFSFHCKKCDFRLHVKCAFLPETVDCKAHKHTLEVRHYTPKSNKDDFDTILCDVCDGCATEGFWSYYCKDCDFCTHLECAFTADVVTGEEEKKNGDEEEEEEEDNFEESDAMKLHRANIKAMDQMARLQFQMQMAQLNARTVAMIFRTNV